jgi:hypothetical protein
MQCWIISQATYQQEEGGKLLVACFLLLSSMLYHCTLKMEAKYSSETLRIFLTASYYNLEDRTFHSRRNENSNPTVHSLWSVRNFCYVTDSPHHHPASSVPSSSHLLPFSQSVSLVACSLWRSSRETIGMIAITPSGTPLTEVVYFQNPNRTAVLSHCLWLGVYIIFPEGYKLCTYIDNHSTLVFPILHWRYPTFHPSY